MKAEGDDADLRPVLCPELGRFVLGSEEEATDSFALSLELIGGEGLAGVLPEVRKLFSSGERLGILCLLQSGLKKDRKIPGVE